MTDHSNFFNLINSSPTLAERWVKVASQVVTAGRELFGVHLDHDDVASIAAARAATLGAHDLDDYMDELSALEKVKERHPNRPKSEPKLLPETQHPLADERTAARNFAEARKSGFKPPADASPPLDSLSDVQKLQFLLTLPPGDGRKISLGRKWGLIK